MSSAIQIEQLVKTFGSTRALDGLDLEVRTGEVHGFLGPNGSGKTVTIRILLGLLRADSGTVSLLGGDPWSDAVELHRHIAYVPGDVNLWPNLSGGETIDLLTRLREGGGSVGRQAVDLAKRDELIERLALDPTKKSRTYSKGNRQKVALIAGLSSSADVLLLDEPTSGLDPLMESVFQECVLEATAEGRTVLLSSHILAEVEKLCDRVTIIRQGRTVQSGTLDEMRHLTRTSISVATDRPITGLAAIDGVHDVAADDGEVRFDVDAGALDGTIRHVSSFGIRSLVSQPPTLEELFLRHYGDELDVASGRLDEAASS
ncbi:MAG TPA: ABC transporter ATP-binding protein [Ilumatobacteraceae bacterium]|nr:ABC transporter ATP-binding protein [Ilumatobacteraceae bacterium]